MSLATEWALPTLGAALLVCALGAACSVRDEPATPPPGMIRVSGGEFTMGSDDSLARPRERPPHRVKVAGFFMDATPVTNAQFRVFDETTG